MSAQVAHVLLERRSDTELTELWYIVAVLIGGLVGTIEHTE